MGRCKVMKKVLVLGCNGMAGHIISLYLEENQYNVFGVARESKEMIKTFEMDVADFNELQKIIEINKFDVIINSIGLLNQYAEVNKEKAVLLNSYLPHFLVKITENSNTKIIHLSTDCVFSGKKGNYNEDDFTDGPTFYDKSKALGEIIDNKNLTFRNSIVGPDLKSEGIGLFNWFMQQDGEIKGFNKVYWNGVTTLKLAEAIKYSIEEDITGIYHLVNDEGISKYELLKIFNNISRNGKLIIKKSEEFKSNKMLINNRKDFDFIVPSYNEMINDQNDWIKNHKKLYEHYNV